MYDSFIAYQNRMMMQFDKMVDNYGFTVIDGRRSIDAVFADLKGQMSELLHARSAAAADPAGLLKQSRHEAAAQEIAGAEKLPEQDVLN
jgi:hypothetical protein